MIHNAYWHIFFLQFGLLKSFRVWLTICRLANDTSWSIWLLWLDFCFLETIRYFPVTRTSLAELKILRLTVVLIIKLWWTSIILLRHLKVHRSLWKSKNSFWNSKTEPVDHRGSFFTRQVHRRLQERKKMQINDQTELDVLKIAFYLDDPNFKT